MIKAIIARSPYPFCLTQKFQLRKQAGYYGTDVDLNGTVNASDRSAVWNNRNISTQVPTPVDNPNGEVIIYKNVNTEKETGSSNE